MALPPEDLPDPTQVEGAPHPRAAPGLFGQDAAEAEFLRAFASGRPHHAWLLAGPRGVGKATLAWRIARFLVAAPDGGPSAPPPDTLDLPPGHPVARRIAAGSEGRVFHLRRGANGAGTALSDDIRVDEVRKLRAFLALSETDGGRRVAIIDSVDELAASGANALLKLLEEPPARVTLLLVSHRPRRLLPTIRSRCRVLRLVPLGPAAMAAALAQAGVDGDAAALAQLSGGSVGEALRIAGGDGVALYAGLVALFGSVPGLDRAAALALAEKAAGRAGEARFDLTLYLTDLFLSRVARAGALGHAPPAIVPGEAALIARLAPSPQAAQGWADLAQGLGLRARAGRAVNLDPAALLLDSFLRIDETAGQLARR